MIRTLSVDNYAIHMMHEQALIHGWSNLITALLVIAVLVMWIKFMLEVSQERHKFGFEEKATNTLGWALTCIAVVLMLFVFRAHSADTYTALTDPRAWAVIEMWKLGE